MSHNIDFTNLRSVINKAFYALLFIEKRFILMIGGRGSGKSKFIAQMIIYESIIKQSQVILCVRKVKETLRDSLYSEILEIIKEWELSDLFHCKVSPMEIICKLNGNKIVFRGLDEPQKIKSIRGISKIVAEEFLECTRTDFDELDMILRSEKVKLLQFWMLCNPGDINHWIKRELFDNPDADTQIHVSTYKNNPHLHPSVVKRIEALQDIDFELYRRYALGKWGQLTGLIFSNWHVEDFSYHEIEYYDEAYGIDYGFEHASGLVHLGFYKGSNDVDLTEILHQTKLTPDNLVEEIKLRIPDTKRHVPIYPDSARPDLSQMLANAGFTIMDTDKSVFAGIMSVKECRLRVSADSHNLKDELTSYKWRTDRTGVLVRDNKGNEVPVKYMDDLIDPTRYAIHTRKVNNLGGYLDITFID